MSFTKAALTAGLVGVLLPAVAGSALAQQPVITQFKDWTLACEGVSQCMIRQILINPKTQKPLVTVMIGKPAKLPNPVIVINMPPAVIARELVTFKVDQNDQFGIPGVQCSSTVCSAIANFTPDLASQFQKGSGVSLTFPVQGRRIGITVSLSGFSAAYKALPKS